MAQIRVYLPLLALLITTVTSTITSSLYQLQDDYQISTFDTFFDFFTDNDPTNGYVDYVDLQTAQSLGAFDIRANQVYIGVDNTTIPTNGQRGRKSVRLQSKKSYNHALVVLDLAHMPGGQCGTWPAFWTLSTSKSWPDGGEIDIIEGVNSRTSNSMTMHTNAGCTIPKLATTMSSTSVVNTVNCDVQAAGQGENQGCNIDNSDKTTYGTGFNNVGGGIYALEWTSDHVAIWFFARASIPVDIKAGQPNPGSADWSTPLAMFQGGDGCDIDQHFIDQQIIFDITFCGSWAGQVWSTDSTCSALSSTCTNFVQNRPDAFDETYWLVNSLKVYQTAQGTVPSATISDTTSTTAGIRMTSTTLAIPNTTLSQPLTLEPATSLSFQSDASSSRPSSTTSAESTCWSQSVSQPWSTAAANWQSTWWGGQSQARLLPTGAWQPKIWGAP